MTTKRNRKAEIEFKSVEEKREYWEKRGPLAKGARSKLVKPIPRKKLESFLSIRLSGKELTEFRDLAFKCGRGPSTLAREILLAFMSYIGTNKSESERKQIPIEDFCEALDAKMPEVFKDRIAHLMKSSVIGDVNKPSLIIYDPSQIKELEELSTKIMALLVESANPNIKIVTPYDRRYEQVKSVLETKGKYDAAAKT